MYNKCFLAIIYLSLALSLFNCRSDKKSSLSEIDLSGYLKEEPESVTLSSIASNIEYIPLEVKDQSVFRQGSSISGTYLQLVDSIFFITDRDVLLSFDYSGKFLTSYGSQGRGPSEYIQLTDFTVFKEKKQVMILASGSNKIISYGYDGRYEEEIKIGSKPSSCIYFNGKLVCFYPRGLREENNNFVVNVYNLDGSLYRQLINRKKDMNDFPLASKRIIGRFFRSEIDGNLHFCESDHATIAVMSPDFSITNFTPIVFERSKDPAKTYIEEAQKADLHTISANVTKLDHSLITENYIFIQLLHEGLGKRIVYDKTKSKGYKYYMGPVNDLDGGPNFWPTEVTSDGRLLMLINGNQLLRSIKNQSKFGNVTPFVPDDRLRELIEKPEFEGVPIVVVVTLK
jgi:hypothetical protein